MGIELEKAYVNYVRKQKENGEGLPAEKEQVFTEDGVFTSALEILRENFYGVEVKPLGDRDNKQQVTIKTDRASVLISDKLVDFVLSGTGIHAGAAKSNPPDYAKSLDYISSIQITPLGADHSKLAPLLVVDIAGKLSFGIQGANNGNEKAAKDILGKIKTSLKLK